MNKVYKMFCLVSVLGAVALTYTCFKDMADTMDALHVKANAVSAKVMLAKK